MEIYKMGIRYDKSRQVIVIGKPIEISLKKTDYEAVQRVTNKRFEEFYRGDNNGRIQIENGRVRVINLSELELKTLSPDIGKLSSLEYLDVSRNQLTRVPDSIGNLSSLRGLYLSGNPLTQVPDSIVNLSSLEYLYLDRTQLTQVPDSIGNLKLLVLDVSKNQLTQDTRKLLDKLSERGVQVIYS